jgi:hypothetical protein
LTNPSPNDPDRGAIWTMLVERDIDAFVKADWSMVDVDFVSHWPSPITESFPRRREPLFVGP